LIYISIDVFLSLTTFLLIFHYFLIDVDLFQLPLDTF
jgi:hypothetical protein